MDLGNNKIDNLYCTQIGKASLYVAFMIYKDGLYSSSNDVSPYPRMRIYPHKNGSAWINLLIASRSKPYFV